MPAKVRKPSARTETGVHKSDGQPLKRGGRDWSNLVVVDDDGRHYVLVPVEDPDGPGDHASTKQTIDLPRAVVHVEANQMARAGVALTRLLGNASDLDRNAALSVLGEGPADDEEDGSEDWGPAPSKAAVLTAMADNLKLQFDDRRELEQQSLSRERVAALLDMSPQAVTAMIQKNKLIGLKAARRWRIPVWQLAPGSVDGFVPGIDRLRAVFPGGVVELSAWAVKPSPRLSGRIPRDVLAAGEVDQVVAVASQLTSAGW